METHRPTPVVSLTLMKGLQLLEANTIAAEFKCLE
jgi:hypothetical protein